MKKRLILFGVCLALVIAAFPVTALADSGPKPSVVIDFKGISGQVYYVTLLSSVPSTGPYSAPEAGAKDRYNGDSSGYSVFEKFRGYRDEDGYYFLQYFQDCSETHQFGWTYYPPPTFKILIYFYDSDYFAVSDRAYDRYAFDSYYSVSLTDAEISAAIAQDKPIVFTAAKSYNYGHEIISFAARAILTIAVELLAALLFAFRRKRQLIFIAGVNLATQLGLNAALNLIHYNHVPMAFIFPYILLEALVFIIEASLYTSFLPRYGDASVPKWRAISYALIANAASFAAGIGLARIIPGIF